MRAIELISPFSPEECIARLCEAADCGGVLSWFGSKPVLGRVSGLSVRLRKRLRYRNSFQTWLFGSLEPHPEGAVFQGKAGMHPLTVGFMWVWFGGLLLIGCLIFIAAITGDLRGELHPALAVAVAPAMAAFGAGLLWCGRWLARGEERFLVNFVARVLNARQFKRVQEMTDQLWHSSGSEFTAC